MVALAVVSVALVGCGDGSTEGGPESGDAGIQERKVPTAGPALLPPSDSELLAGLTLGADPVATSMLHARAAEGGRLDAFVVRKAGKAHGLQQRIEGPSIEGRRVLIVEDTSTTGSSPLEAARAALAAGATVVGVATIADRATGAAERFAEAGLDYRFVYGLSELGLS